MEKKAELIGLTGDYRAVIDHQAALGLTGGSIYDALAAQAARKVGADRLLTLNEGDFRRVWPDAANRIAAP